MRTLLSLLLLTSLAHLYSAIMDVPVDLLPVDECKTSWFNRDAPGGMGDYETLVDLRNEYPNQICKNPVGVEVQTLTGIPAQSTGQTFAVFNSVKGFACVNAANLPTGCLNYKIRFICPCPDQCRTRWFDRDNPGGVGDFETLANLMTEYPGQICPSPIGIEVQTTAGIPAYSTGQSFSYYDVITGFACVNSNTQQCQDYKVLFICPASFCSACRTRWFDVDNPGGLGDYESIAGLLNAYPQEVCLNPVGIESQTLPGVPAGSTGQMFSVYDAANGFACQTAQQPIVISPCLDYKVRLTCPKAFCNVWQPIPVDTIKGAT